MSTWLFAAPQPLGVRVTVGATLNPELVPLIGLEGVNGIEQVEPDGEAVGDRRVDEIARGRVRDGHAHLPRDRAARHRHLGES